MSSPVKSGPTTDAVTDNDPSVRQASFELCRKMLDPAALHAFQTKSDAQGIFHFAAHVALLVVFAALQYSFYQLHSEAGSLLLYSVMYVACLVGEAMCLAFLFTGFHEMTHETVFATRWLNAVCGNAWGFAIFRPFRHYKSYHYNHHKFTGDPVRDPELQNSLLDLSLTNIFAYVLYLSGIPFWVDRVTTLLRHCFFGVASVNALEWKYFTSKTAAEVVLEARQYVSLYAALFIAATFSVPFCPTLELLWNVWIFPTLVAQPFLRFYLIAEHMSCPQGDNMLSNTRTTETYAWYRWLAWNMPYHAEHHAFPFVPFYNLPALHHELKKRKENDVYRKCQPNGDSGYLGVHLHLIKKFF